jgi:DNA-binding FadR family transcriptional regulator
VTAEIEIDDAVTAEYVAKEFGVGASIAGSVPKLLIAKGVARNRQRTGAVIRPKHEWDFVDAELLDWLLDFEEFGILELIQETRFGIESLAARSAASRIAFYEHDALTKRAQKIFELGYEHRVKFAQNVEEFGRVDVEYHGLVMSASGNPVVRHFTTAFQKSIRKRLHTPGSARKTPTDDPVCFPNKPEPLGMLLHVAQAKAIVSHRPAVADIVTRAMIAEFTCGLDALFERGLIERAVRELPWTATEESRYKECMDEVFPASQTFPSS